MTDSLNVERRQALMTSYIVTLLECDRSARLSQIHYVINNSFYLQDIVTVDELLAVEDELQRLGFIEIQDAVSHITATGTDNNQFFIRAESDHILYFLSIRRSTFFTYIPGVNNGDLDVGHPGKGLVKADYLCVTMDEKGIKIGVQPFDHPGFELGSVFLFNKNIPETAGNLAGRIARAVQFLEQGD